ncbi:AP1-like transcription factor-like protein [Lentithecium fluviatile CBS 122367]|uniref:AP1-like transcription factor-like protein n=1 Tax=Lentithecium fluviatile CBS 122367 TaxID=1168545 RepID=A0A6G1ID82_9PLEO|nr:AP1-like transcription factor-like protein [Lentithecium fluviatile CBS 122367]
MAGTSTNDYQNGASFYLDPNQQDLLLAALSSNTQNANDIFGTGMIDNKQPMNGQQFQFPVDHVDPYAFTSPQQGTPATAFNNVGVEESPFADYLDGDTSFDFDGADNGELMIGDLPGDSPSKNDDTPEKRKSPGDVDDDAEGGGKRREGEDKQAKKPGRKPLTSEPTTKRKAQNRAAQRAFRERKEKHLKDLETKVAELEKASDATNHENGLLRAQVQRLQVELREYRKRLSLNSTGVNRSPPIVGGFSSLLNNGGANASNFQFDFPRFGGLPGAHILDNGPLSKNKSASNSSTGRSLSPKTQSNGSNATSPDKTSASPATNGAQRSGSINGFASYSNAASTDSSNPNRIFTFNSSSSTHSDSPSTSSNSAGGQNSSCDTSPEPSHNSPGNGDTIAEGYVCHGNSEGEITFCEKLNMACGNPRNPIPRAMSSSDTRSPPAGTAKTPATDFNGIDFFANQNGGQFDPALFGDYRDSQAAIVGDGDFTNGFFNEAFPITDFGSPFHFGDTPAVQKPNPIEEIERLQDGEEEVVPGEDVSQMLNCHKIWDKLANRPDFKDGTIDIDNLCSELRAKARCSESGVVVDHKDVEAALKRLPQDQR